MTHVVIGVGNAYRRDDGVGLAVAARLEARVPAGVEVVGCELEPSRLLDAWQGAETAFVVDAVRSGADPGTLHRFDAGADPVPASLFRSSSTHAFGVGEAVELARALGTLPSRLVLFGIEGGEFVAGEGLTDAVQAAVDPAAAAVLEELEQLRREEEEPCTSER
ncbi:MAG: hypothetical protein K0T00_360 [Gaiellaceae bacterium]|nr:hypothetical protein [Gaiellaceae bacterium]